jgi:hypothetical protein
VFIFRTRIFYHPNQFFARKKSGSSLFFKVDQVGESLSGTGGLARKGYGLRKKLDAFGKKSKGPICKCSAASHLLCIGLPM